MAQILQFVDVEADPEPFVDEVRPPDSLGRWRFEDEAAVAELTRLTAPALLRCEWTP